MVVVSLYFLFGGFHFLSIAAVIRLSLPSCVSPVKLKRCFGFLSLALSSQPSGFSVR